MCLQWPRHSREHLALIQEVCSLKQVLSISEVDRLLDTLNTNTPLETRNKAMIELMYGTGLRVSELVNLKLQDIDLTEEVVRAFGKGSKEGNPQRAGFGFSSPACYYQG